MAPLRIAPLQLPLDEAGARRMGKLIPSQMPPPQLFLISARNAHLWEFLVDSGAIGPTGLMDLHRLDPRLREIVVLRTCVANRCDYEFNLHVQTISERMGLSMQQIEDLCNPQVRLESWTAAERSAVALVDALVHRREVTDPEFEAVRPHFDDATLIEITHLVGLYTGVAMTVALTRPGFDLYRYPQPILAQPASETAAP